ncbi:MAG: hypothetical protein KDB86_06375 [Actinobacteria bacterium]|nr:hypothetical protein [Actinomycetota bacterium]MCB9388899.1 hypothetical protein [Acidimicrobiia bacterium]
MLRKALIKRRLADLTERIARAREELRVTEEQLAVVAYEAEDLRLRALMSDNLADADAAQRARRQAEVMTRHRDRLVRSLQQDRAEQDSLLDRMSAGGAD